MESREEMDQRHTSESFALIARHQRELDKHDSRWWEEWFIKNPIDDFCEKVGPLDGDSPQGRWFKTILPNIIRKRDKIGVTVYARNAGATAIISWGRMNSNEISLSLAEKLAGRTLAPGERVEI